MKAFITGITGFAGSHLAEHLLECGDEVIGCSRSGYWKKDAPAVLVRGVPVMRWDVARAAPTVAKQRLAAFAPECVYHLAAISVPKDCGEAQPNQQAWAVNVEGTSAVIEVLASLPQRPRMLLASSCHVYAPVTRQRPVVREDAPLGPSGGYGKTKLAAEQVLVHAVQRGEVDGVIARTFKHTGPRQNPRMMLPEWCIQIARGGSEPLHVLNLDSYFDLTDVRDVVRAYRMLAIQGQPAEAYNVGSGVCRRSGDVVEQLRRVAGVDRRVVELEPGIRQEPIADISRLRRLTGWRPEIPLEQTLAHTLAYWKRHGGRVHQPPEP